MLRPFRVEFFLSGRFRAAIHVLAKTRNEAWQKAAESPFYRQLLREAEGHIGNTRNRRYTNSLTWRVLQVSLPVAKGVL